MVCNSVLGDGETSGSSIRASRYKVEFERRGYEVTMVYGKCKRRYNPLIVFAYNSLWNLGFLVKGKYDFCYSISDLLPDATFGIAYKTLHPTVKFICGCHCILPQGMVGRSKLHTLYSYWSQQVILWMLRYTADKMLVSNPYDRQLLLNRGFKNVTVVFGAPNF